jgi:DNA repair photolyase
MSFDTYSNCAHQCVYCFAYFQRGIGHSSDDYLAHRVKPVNVDRVKKMFLDPDRHAGDFAAYIKARYVLQWGGLSDGFDYYERHFRVSLELLRFFREIDYPVSISTKGTWFLDDPEYREVLEGAKNTHWKYSIICTDEEKAKGLEAGCPSPAERFEAMRQLNELGVGATTLRLRPFIIGVSDLDSDELLERAVDVGCYSMTTEFLCIEKRASKNHRQRYDRISEIVGYDVWEYYRRHSFSGSGLMRLNYDLKRPYIEAMETKAAELGLPFFVSDAHHKERSMGGGCCGLPADGPLSNWNRGQYSEAIQIAKDRGSVRWSDIAEDAEWMKTMSGWKHANVQDTRSKARNLYNTMFDYLRNVWNTPTSWSSPARYFGGALVPAGLDESGDVIYVYNKPFVEDGEAVASVPDLLERIAEAKDKARGDGGRSGHVAFPIFVPTKGRHSWKMLPTVELLVASRLNPILVVEPQEVDAYRDAFPSLEVLEIDADDRGLAYVRQWILDYAREERLAFYWTMDDDVSVFWDGDEDATARAALSFAESFLVRYAEVGQVGFSQRTLAVRSTREFELNKGISQINLNATDSGVDYDPDVDTSEDMDFSIATISSGRTTIRINRFSFDPSLASGGAAKMPKGAGGCETLYAAGSAARSTRRLAEKWPEVVSLIRDGDRPKVSWTKISGQRVIPAELAREEETA